MNRPTAFAISCLMCVACLHAADEDLVLAKEALAVSRQRLSQDPKDSDGLALFKMAKAMTPTFNDVTAMNAEIAAGAIAKPFAPVKLDIKNMAEKLVFRADFLLKESFKENVDIGYLINLYLRVAERTRPADKLVRTHLALLETYGIREGLEAAYVRDYKLLDTKKNPVKAEARPVHPLPKADSGIAYECIRKASKLLANDTTNELGRLYLDVGLHLRPNLISAIVLRDKADLKLKITAFPGGVSDQRLVAALVDRAEYHLTKANKDGVSAHLSLLFYRLIERLEPTNRNALLGIVRLEKLKQSGSLKRLLGGASLATVAGLEKGVGPKPDPVTVVPPPVRPDVDGPADGENADNGDKKKEPIRWDRVDVRGRVRKREGEVRVFPSIKNGTATALKKLTVETYLIGRNKRGKAFYVANKTIAGVESIEDRKTAQLKPTVARFGVYPYFSWLIAIKDSKGKLVTVKAHNSIIEKIAEKVIAMRSDFSSEGVYINSYRFFDRNGESVANP